MLWHSFSHVEWRPTVPDPDPLRRGVTPGGDPAARAPARVRRLEVRQGSPFEAACAALRLGDRRAVFAAVHARGKLAGSDAACLNLLGVLCEARGRPAAAKRLYARAVRADRRLEAAQQNMRRLYDLHAFGRTAIPPAVGDPLTDLWLARRAARVRPAARRPGEH